MKPMLVIIQAAVLASIAVTVGVWQSHRHPFRGDIEKWIDHELVKRADELKREQAQTDPVITDDNPDQIEPGENGNNGGDSGNNQTDGDGEGDGKVDPSSEVDKPDVDPDKVTPPEVMDPNLFKERINAEQAKVLFDEGAWFLDARLKSQYEKSHVEGAVHIPPQAFHGGNVPSHFTNQYITPDMGPLVIYCIGGNCDDSEMVTLYLKDMGFKYHILAEGYPAWEKAEYPMEEGPDPYAGQ